MTQTPKGPRTSLFAYGSGVYLLVVLVGAWLLGFFNPKWTPISPSEWGDVLAGVFSPLAFLWLLYASLSQRAELELQRDELRQNNQTQQEQQEAMEKQARALNAQVERLKAEAAAQYEPIIVLNFTNLNFSSDRYFSLTNVGGTVLNISFSEGLSPNRIFADSKKTREAGRVISHWSADEQLTVDISDDLNISNGIVFDVRMRRLDLVSVTHTYRMVDRFARIELIARNEDAADAEQ